MGMFSRIYVDKVEFQFKTGWDDGYTYKIGDRIEWTPDLRWPGSHIDGVHEASSYPERQQRYVVIKDCVVVAVEPWEAGPYALETKYGITKPPRHLWPEQAWAEMARREKASQDEYEAWLAENPGGCPVSYFTRMKLREKSVVDQLFPAVRIA